MHTLWVHFEKIHLQKVTQNTFGKKVISRCKTQVMQSIGDVLSPDEANVRTMIFSPRTLPLFWYSVHFLALSLREVIKERQSVDIKS